MLTLHSTARYLIFFQYAGTKYSGVMRIPADQAGQGVENHLESAVRKLKPVNEVSVSISSRTDSGVHALCNSAHVDIQRRAGKPPLPEQTLVEALNFHLKAEPIRITRAYRVHSDFHARYRAISRTYVYRFASGLRHHTEMPVTERDLCWALRDTRLNINAMQEATALLIGTHDFSTFRALNSETPFKNPVKSLESARLEPGVSFSQRHFHRDIQFWELTFKSRSFLYRQVRRMTGALVAVGQGRLSVSQIQELLEARDSLAFPNNLTAPAHGLFLTQVQYRDADLGRLDTDRII
ncbi:tRNA pseudouridine synthase-like 1 [Pimephales promelas]|uniref:tRNA pseudouridine synthase-like 1 n=1 Tax=Pimephales promelas TaxID=90988 RepID=UPI001955EF49|nr:tRNA pseudouridine synthase-like 1 [Pimephales promelas]KAG1931119.1 tRNA pseudouridine synthase-like [Pimephales promelas]